MRHLKSLVAAALLAAVPPAVFAGENQVAMDHAKMGMDHSKMQGMGDPQAKGMTQDTSAPTAENPYSEAEMKMNRARMAAVGKDADETWVRKMIEHHRGAIDMANTALSKTQDSEVKQKAEQTIESQEKEIKELQAWLRSHHRDSEDGMSGDKAMPMKGGMKMEEEKMPQDKMKMEEEMKPQDGHM